MFLPWLTEKLFHSESKLDPEGPAYQKMKNSKKFDPKRSSVLMVLNAQVIRNGKKDEQSMTNISDIIIPTGDRVLKKKPFIIGAIVLIIATLQF